MVSGGEYWGCGLDAVRRKRAHGSSGGRGATGSRWARVEFQKCLAYMRAVGVVVGGKGAGKKEQVSI